MPYVGFGKGIASYTRFLRRVHVEYNGTMDKLTSRLSVVPYLIIGVALLLLGLLAINHIMDNLWPIDVTRLDLIRDVARDQADATKLLRSANSEIVVAFLASVLVAATGLSLPLAYYMNKRFGGSQSHSFLVVLSQAMWVGIWIAFCTWLQMNRTFGIGVALLVAAVLVTLEVLLQIRTRAAAMASSEV